MQLFHVMFGIWHCMAGSWDFWELHPFWQQLLALRGPPLVPAALPCSETALLGASCAFLQSEPWDGLGLGPNQPCFQAMCQGLNIAKTLLDSYFLTLSLVISYCANCCYLLLDKINTLINRTDLTTQRWWGTEMLKERIVLKIFLELTARLFCSFSWQ